MPFGTEGWAVNVTPRPLYSRDTAQLPAVQEVGWAPGPVWTGAEISPTPGSEPRKVQQVASRYTDYAILAAKKDLTGVVWSGCDS